MKVQLKNNCNGKIGLLLSLNDKKINIRISNFFDPFEEIEYLLKELELGYNAKLRIDEEGREKILFFKKDICNDKVYKLIIEFWDQGEKIKEDKILIKNINNFINNFIFEIEKLLKEFNLKKDNPCWDKRYWKYKNGKKGIFNINWEHYKNDSK